MMHYQHITVSSNEIQIRVANSDDTNTIVDIHISSFPGFFLSFLGRSFLRELYLGIINDPDGLTFVAAHPRDGKLFGFVTGTTEPAGLYARLIRKRWWRFALAVVAPVMRRPKIIFRLLRAFQKPAEAKSMESNVLLMSIAVAPDAQGLGVGGLLVDKFINASSERKKSKRLVVLTTDRDNNDYVNHFYKRKGFKLRRYFQTPEKRWMNEYQIEI